jgi:hypothetical protein
VDERVALDAYALDGGVRDDGSEMVGVKGKGDLGTKVLERRRGRFGDRVLEGFRVGTVRSAAAAAATGAGCERGSWAAGEGVGEWGGGLFCWEEGIDDGLWGPEPWGGRGVHEGFEMAHTSCTKDL